MRQAGAAYVLQIAERKKALGACVNMKLEIQGLGRIIVNWYA
jgi:hypothetical protein